MRKQNQPKPEKGAIRLRPSDGKLIRYDGNRWQIVERARGSVKDGTRKSRAGQRRVKDGTNKSRAGEHWVEDGTRESRAGQRCTIGQSAAKRTAVASQLDKKMPNIAEGDLIHATTMQAWQKIQKDKKLDVNKAEHGKLKAVWAGKTAQAATLHLMNAARHQEKIKADNYRIQLLVFKEGTPQAPPLLAVPGLPDDRFIHGPRV